jgi:hypothetical protein
VKPVEEALAFRGADSVYVPGDQRDAFWHGGSIANGVNAQNPVSLFSICHLF